MLFIAWCGNIVNMQKTLKGGFWEKLNKPFFVLAPMADVTDVAFRRIIAKYGKPDVTWTEFISADGLFLADKEGKEKIKRDMEFSEEERPIVVQFFTSHPDMMRKAAKYAAELGFDGFDINMGCPDRSIEKQKAGAALMKTPLLAQELIRAAKKGIDESGRYIPVSVKTRIGYNSNDIEDWLPVLLKAEPAVITIHARTRKEMSKVPADWSQVKRAVEIRDDIRNKQGSNTLIIGNGDVTNLEDGQNRVRESGCDGVMLGRAVFGNPWLFNKDKKEISIKGRLNVLVEHTKLYEELLGDVKSFNIMKKHYKAYVSGWDGAKELRIKLMDAKDAKEVESTVKKYLRI